MVLRKQYIEPQLSPDGVASLFRVVESICDTLGLSLTSFCPNWCAVVNLFMSANGQERELLAAVQEIAESRKLGEMVKLAGEAVSDDENAREMVASNLERMGELVALLERYFLNRGRRHFRRRRRF